MNLDAPDAARALVLERARAVGFDLVGIAAAGETPRGELLSQWLRQGLHADMDWMTRQARADVRHVLPGARSVIVVARNYYHPRPPKPSGTGRVSAYAWGRDYHQVLGGMLKRLVRELEAALPGQRWYWSVDTAPVQERAWAAQAGIGWIGKHSLVLTRSHGSWLFLATILTTLELTPDAPVGDHCGSCRRCVEACPTGAILPGSIVDADKCISYHTIENRGEIPVEIARAAGDWVFGCDICQEVCPWNRFARLSDEPAFAPRSEQAHPDLERLASLDDEAFRAAFQGTPIKRAKRAGMARNAAVARANQAVEPS